eukprot:gnl/TRDRNA2_/TRDRNA2_138728_c2_seq1.p1 gnl/TRDRNA2_/TRDRNA2_138728_c2~~gnl/TRDRNA2_/TRDRNA2_138728_c2_seq1.p1  ORF type:complete len:284 (-),score=35.59 gnl/TRDRNA2_/TRDRNA2_138728_c2_seq1:3-767(-)
MSEEDKRRAQEAVQAPTWWLKLLGDVLSCVMAIWHSGVNFHVMYRWFGSTMLHASVNTRRLPNLPVKNLESLLGDFPWLERVWSNLWFGAVPDVLHYDDPDNLVIALHGDIYISVWEQNDTTLLNGGRGYWTPHFDLPSLSGFATAQTVEAAPWVRHFPFITLKLEVGQGILIPSRTYHSLAVPDATRVLLNAWIMPKYGELWDAPASAHSFYRAEMQAPEYAALRHLKSSTIYRLWDTRHLGGWFDGSKLEML